jgi:hypothetical protein
LENNQFSKRLFTPKPKPACLVCKKQNRLFLVAIDSKDGQGVCRKCCEARLVRLERGQRVRNISWRHKATINAARHEYIQDALNSGKSFVMTSTNALAMLFK